MQERGDVSEGHGAKAGKANANGFFGSLKDALLAAGRDETAAPAQGAAAAVATSIPPPVPAAPIAAKPDAGTPPAGPSAEEAARLARAAAKPLPKPAIEAPVQMDAPPTTRVVRREPAPAAAEEDSPRTQLVRGKQKIERGGFDQDPVVGFLVVVGGPGLGSHRPIFEGNNTVGRSSGNRIAIDFGDDTISSDAQAYIRYDSSDRAFLFVPNLAKTNVVSVNDKRPTAAVALKPMDVITLGRTQVAFVPFCGADFDWSEISET